jgi:hypothetical protein
VAVGERSYARARPGSDAGLYERTLLAMTREETARRADDTEKRVQLVHRERERLAPRTAPFVVREPTLHRLTEHLPAAMCSTLPCPHRHPPEVLDDLPQETDHRFLRAAAWQFTEMTIVTTTIRSRACFQVMRRGARCRRRHFKPHV